MKKDEVIKLLKVIGISEKEIAGMIEIPKDFRMGDYAFPCFSLARKLRKSPDEIAKNISERLTEKLTDRAKPYSGLSKIEPAGPYVNFYLDRLKLAREVISEIKRKKEKYGSNNSGKKRIMVEFSQPNTHKAFHLGHVKATSLGESISRILDFCGNKVIRANYSGDTGMHVARWLWCYLKYHKKEKIKEDESWFAGIYAEAIKKLEKNKKFQKEADEINRKLDSRDDKKLDSLWKKTRELSVKSWKGIYKDLDTSFDVHYFESEFEREGKKISKELVKKEIAEMSDGAVITNLRKHGLGIWVLLRQDGTVLYSAKDLALAKRKFSDFKIQRAIYVVGTEQKLHIQQLFKTLEITGFRNSGVLDYVPVSHVRFPWGKMSSRTGDNVLYSAFKKELLKHAVTEIKKRYSLKNPDVKKRALSISIASLKYSMLKHDLNKTVVFNPKESLSFEGNTGPYLLYSYARAMSILKKAGYNDDKTKDIDALNEHEEKLILSLSRFPDIVITSHRDLSPNLIANYAYELAKEFNEFYHESKVIGSEAEKFRLGLVFSFSQVLKNALYLLGIQAIKEM